MNQDDDTDIVPTPLLPSAYRAERDHLIERRIFIALFVAYLVAGGVLAFALLELEAVAERLNSSPICRRL